MERGSAQLRPDGCLEMTAGSTALNVVRPPGFAVPNERDKTVEM